VSESFLKKEGKRGKAHAKLTSLVFPLTIILLALLISTQFTIVDNQIKADSSSIIDELDQWIQTNGPEGAPMTSIVTHPTDGNVLYASGPGGGIYKSINAGETWVLKDIPGVHPSDHLHSLIIDTISPNTLYVAGGSGIWKTTDGGDSWQAKNNGINPYNLGITSLIMNPEDSNTLYAGTTTHYPEEIPRSLYKTTDGGESWIKISSELNIPVDGEITALDVTGSHIYVGVYCLATWQEGRLFHSTDGGATWAYVDFDQPKETYIFSVLIDSANVNEVWVGLHSIYNIFSDQVLFVTMDGGKTWNSVNNFPGSEEVMILSKSPSDILYVNTNNFYMTSNNGLTWELLMVGQGIVPAETTGGPNAIAFSPDDEDTLYVALRFGSGLAKSTDGGRTWYRINKGILNTSVSLLTPHPSNPGTLYAAAVGGEGTFKTTDYGATWTWLSGQGITHPFADELVIDPHNPETVWEVADVGDIFQTTNGGTTWDKIIRPSGHGFRAGSVSVVAPAPSDPDTIYAGKNGFGIFKSIDGGESWQFLHQSEVDYTYSIAVHPNNSNIVYSGYNPKPFQDWAIVRQTTDGGTTWRTSLTVYNSSGITSVVIDPHNTETIYAGSTGKSGGEIFKSTDGGNSWSKINEHFTMCTVWGQPMLLVDHTNPSIAYTGTWLAGTWKTNDAGENWILLEEAPISSTSLSLNKLNSSIIYSADRTKPKVWKSTDAGLTWIETADFSSNGAFLVNRVSVYGNIVYASTFGPSLHGGKLYKSTDSGSTWNDITGDLPRSVLDIAFDFTNRDVIYVTTHVYGAYKSTDSGMTWNQMQNFPNIGAYDIEVDPVDPTILYACGLGNGSVPDWCMEPDGYTFTDDSGVYKSNDSGQTWSKILTTSNECRAIRLHPNNHNVIYASAMDEGLQVSTDGGNSWSSYNMDLDTLVLTSCALGGEKIYVGTQGYGVYSGDVNLNDWSVTWQPNRSNKPIPEVYSLQVEVDPGNSNRIFVGSNPGGLYRSDDGGVTFYDKNFLTPSVVVDDPLRQGYYTFSLNPSDTNEVWLGTWGKGVYKSYDGMDFDINAHGADVQMYGKYIYQIIIDPNPPHTVFVACEDGVFKSSDGGASWSDFSTGLDTTQIRTLALTKNGRLLCGTLGYELFYYNTANNRWEQMNAFHNFGTFWPIWNNRPLYQYTSLLFHPTDPNIIYLGTFPAGIYKSIDGGLSWRETNVGWLNDGVFSLVFHPENHDILYAGTYNGISRSTDAGSHWEIWDQGWPVEQWVFSIDFNPSDPNVMYACSKNGENEGTGREGFHGIIMKSTNGGDSWFSIADGLDLNQEFYKIIVDKHNPDILYLATQYDGIFISRDGGILWQPWNDGLINLVAGTNGNNVANPMALSTNGRYLHFGTAGSGIFRRKTVGFEGVLTSPVADAGGPYLGFVNQTVVFNASDSYDSDGIIINYSWNFGDEMTGDGVTSTHIYSTAGNYTVTLTLMDDDRLTELNIATMRVLNRIPFADFVYSPNEPTIKDTIILLDSSEAPYGSIISWYWEFGDGSSSVEQNPIHKYSNKGDYSINLTVTDNDGVKKTRIHILTIVNAQPTADFIFSPLHPVNHEEIKFTDKSSDPENKSLTYLWDFGDGHTSNQQNPTHKYDQTGEYTIELTITDDEQASVTKSTRIMVRIPLMEQPWVLIAGVSVILTVFGIILVLKRRAKRAR
jgi:PKD repeat protein/photosystem II stability/assembly factor-like uncharacterized protein